MVLPGVSRAMAVGVAEKGKKYYVLLSRYEAFVLQTKVGGPGEWRKEFLPDGFESIDRVIAFCTALFT